MDGDVATFVQEGRAVPHAEHVNFVDHLDPRSDDGSLSVSLEPVRA